MRRSICFAFAFLLAAGSAIQAKKPDHQWSIGKVLDQSRARYFAGMIHNSSSQTTENGTLNASANSTSMGSSTDTEINGQYSGTATTSTSGTSRPVYWVYDNLVIEGSDTVYFTSERLKPGVGGSLLSVFAPGLAGLAPPPRAAHVAVNEEVKYYVEGGRLHFLDEDNKERSVEIVREVRKIVTPASSVDVAPPETKPYEPNQTPVATEPTLSGPEIARLKKQAARGNEAAQVQLGYMYANGQGVAKDDAESAMWFRKAAEKGDASSQHILGLDYATGLGVPQDYAQAAVWFRKSAEQGDASAQTDLGIRFANGQGLPQDYAEAYFWFDLAASGKLKGTEQENAVKLRDDAASHLTSPVLSQTQERARRWFEDHAVKNLP